jgi:hypothetical protein
MANIVDSYDFIKASTPQGVELNKVYTDKQYNFISDINNGVYSNSNGLTLIQYDLTSIFNSAKATDCASHFLLLPCTTVMTCTNGAAAVAPSAGSFAAVTLKTCTNSLVHSIDLQVDGKNVISLQPLTNIISGFNLASQLSVDDLKTHGRTKGFPKSGLDNPNSMEFLDATAAVAPFTSVPSISNNLCYITNTTSSSDQSIAGIQNFGVANTSIQEKTAFTYAYGNSASGFDALRNDNQLNQSLTPYTIISGTNRIWYNYYVIRLGDLIPVMDNISLIRRFGAVLRIYINTGVVSTQVSNQSLTFDPAYSTINASCPITINNLGACAAGPNPYATGTFTDLTVGFFVGRPPAYSFTTAGGALINYNGLAAPAISNTRYYYSSILVDSLKYADYLASNQSKTVVNKTFLYNSYYKIDPTNSWSQIIQSGVKNIRAVIVVPLISSSVYGFNAYASPFDTVGAAGCGHPLTLTNFNVSIGGVQQLSSTLNYDFENFIEQVALYGKNTSTEYGVESSLFSYEMWNNNRYYIVSPRSTADDDLSPRNIVIQFTNNNNIAIDIIVFTVYEEEFTVNVATGSFTQKM